MWLCFFSLCFVTCYSEMFFSFFSVLCFINLLFIPSYIIMLSLRGYLAHFCKYYITTCNIFPCIFLGCLFFSLPFYCFLMFGYSTLLLCFIVFDAILLESSFIRIITSQKKNLFSAPLIFITYYSVQIPALSN